MKNKLLLFFIFVLSVVFTLEGKELFHFNFKNCNGKTTLKSNDFTLISKEVSLLEQQSSLRLAPSAEIIINGPKVPLSKELTVSAWILNKRDIDLSPILSRGAWGDLQQFVFTAGPEFYTRVGKWNVTGIRNGNKLAISGTWKHITGVFNSGVWQVYVDGKLVFNEITAGDLSTPIFQITNDYIGQHQITVEFTANGNSNTNKYTEDVLII